MSMPNREQREQAHCQVQSSDVFGIAMIIAERDAIKAQRDALLAALEALLANTRTDNLGEFILVAGPGHSDAVAQARAAIKGAKT